MYQPLLCIVEDHHVLFLMSVLFMILLNQYWQGAYFDIRICVSYSIPCLGHFKGKSIAVDQSVAIGGIDQTRNLPWCLTLLVIVISCNI